MNDTGLLSICFITVTSGFCTTIYLPFFNFSFLVTRGTTSFSQSVPAIFIQIFFTVWQRFEALYKWTICNVYPLPENAYTNSKIILLVLRPLAGTALLVRCWKSAVYNQFLKISGGCNTKWSALPQRELSRDVFYLGVP